MSTKTCVSCGGELKFDRNTGLFECTFCGKIHTMRGKDVPLSLARVDADMHAHRFEKAEESLSQLIDLEPENPLFVLRDILCDFHMTSATILLSCAKSNPKTLLEIRDCEKWDDLRNCLPYEQSGMVDRIREYCDVSLKIAELSGRIEKNEDYLDIPSTTSRGLATGSKSIYKPRSTRLAEKANNVDSPVCPSPAEDPDSGMQTFSSDAKAATPAPSPVPALAAAPVEESGSLGRRLFKKIERKITSTQVVQTRIREDAAYDEIIADTKKLEELKKQQQELFLTIKEMEALL